jgi:hypothetical protein
VAEFQAGEVVVPVVPDASGFIKTLKKQLVPGAYQVGQDVGKEIQRGISDQLKGVYEPLKEQTRRQQQQAPREGAQVGGAFARGVKSAMEAAFKSLPKVELDADSSDAQRSIQELRARIETLSGKTVGIDIDAGAAQAEVAAIQRELSAIDGRNVSVDVRADIASALAELATAQAALSAIDGRTVTARVQVDISGAMASIGVLSAALAGLAAIPVGASIAAGLGAIAGPLAAAGAGIAGIAAVAAPSLGRINEALQAQEQAGNAAARGLNAAAGATRNLVIEQAQAQIAQLQAANAADTLKAAQDRVKEATAGVAQAKDRLKSAVQAAASAQASAAARAASAERSLASAQQAALKAQEALNRARADAIKHLQDVARSLRGNALDQRQAALDLKEAEADLAAARRGGNADEIERASIAYERTKLRIEELQAEQERLNEEQAKGVEGNDRVVAAKEQVEAANQRVIDAERALAKAYEESGRAGEEAAKRVADARKAVQDAEKRVDDAKAALERVKRDQKIAKLQEKIRAEQAKQAAKQAAAVPAAQAKATQKMADLSPAEQAAAKAIKSFKEQYEEFQKALAPNILPVITQSLGLIQKSFKPLTPIIRGSTVALQGLLREAKEALGGSFWKEFSQELSSAAPKAIFGLGKAFGNVITGIAGVIKAFLPFTGTIVGGIESATKAFADWGKSLGESEGFKAFIAYVQQNAPKVIQVVKNIWTTLMNLFSGLSGPGAGALDVVVSITDWLAGLSPETLKTFALAALGVVAAFKTWKVITTAVDGVVKSVQTVRTVWSGISGAASLAAKGAKAAAGGIATAVKGIGKGAGKAGTAVWTGVQTAAQKAASVAKTSGTAIATAARTAGSATAKGASAVWSGIQAAAGRAASAARSAGSVIVAAGKAAATAAVGLGRVALGYTRIATQALLARARVVATAVAQRAVAAATLVWAAAQRVLNVALKANPIGLIITAIGLLVAGLIYAYNNSETFRNIVQGVFQAVGAAATWLWENVLKPVFDGLVALWQNVVGPAVTWLWESVIKPAWDAISQAIQTAWTNYIQPALKALWEFLTTTLAPKVLWFHQTIVKPVFDKIGEVIQFVWNNVIQPALKALWAFITETLAPKVLWLHTNVVQPAFSKIGEVIKFAWEKVIQPAVKALWEFITETLPNGFKKGVSLIETFWNGLKKVAAAPVEFVVNTVYNNGIAAVWNAVADALKLPKLPLLKFSGFASGGIYPGYTPGRDIGVAAVSGGEAIMRPEWTRAVGSDFVHGANKAARRGGVAGAEEYMRQRFMGAYAGGGIIGDILSKGVKWGADKILTPILNQASKAMGDSPWGQMLVNIPRTLVDKVVAFLTEKEAAQGGPGAGKAIEYARKQLGKPYQYGATGPGSFDCSGLTMRAWQAGGRKDIPRTSQQQMAWVKQVSKPVPGALGFPNPGHVWLYVNPNTIIEAPQTGLNVRQVAARAAQVIGVPPTEYDSGGFLPTGHSLVFNGTGKPEPILTDRQWQSVQAAAQGGDGSMLHIDEFHATPEQSPAAIARELWWMSKGRPR